MSKEYRVAVVGATGAVGRAMRSILAERDFPVKQLVALATAKSAGMKLDYRGDEVICQELTPDSFKGIDLALFSAGGGTSLEVRPHRPRRRLRGGGQLLRLAHGPRRPAGGARGQPRRRRLAQGHHRQPQLLHHPDGGGDEAAARRSPHHPGGRLHLSGGVRHRSQGHQRAGAADRQAPGRRGAGDRGLPHQIAFNCLPQIDVFLEDGYTKEERKMVDETKKIMGDDSIAVTRHLRARARAEQPLRGGQPGVRRPHERRAGPRAAGRRPPASS